jgi:hypothetical protein
METTQELSPSLVIFVFFSLVLCIWAIVDLFRSNFTKTNKVIWLLVVLFAPFGVFIYLFIGRRFKPLPVAPPAMNVSEDGPPAKEGLDGLSRVQATGWPAPLLLLAIAVFCVLLYLKAVTLLGQEKTAFLLLGAMVAVGAVFTFFHVNQRRKRQ